MEGAAYRKRRRHGIYQQVIWRRWQRQQNETGMAAKYQQIQTAAYTRHGIKRIWRIAAINGDGGNQRRNNLKAVTAAFGGAHSAHPVSVRPWRRRSECGAISGLGSWRASAENGEKRRRKLAASYLQRGGAQPGGGESLAAAAKAASKGENGERNNMKNETAAGDGGVRRRTETTGDGVKQQTCGKAAKTTSADAKIMSAQRKHRGVVCFAIAAAQRNSVRGIKTAEIGSAEEGGKRQWR